VINKLVFATCCANLLILHVVLIFVFADCYLLMDVLTGSNITV